MELGDRLLVAEPVEPLSDRDRVDAVLRQRNAFCGSAYCFDARNRLHQLGTHRVTGLDGDDVRTRLEQRARQLAGSGREIEHSPARPQVQLLGEPGDGCRWIARPRAFVEIRDELERP